MPLPAALAARLAKRGILTPSAPHDFADEPPLIHHVGEEIIAEDYDERGDIDDPTRPDYWENVDIIESTEELRPDPNEGHPGCPNKSNIYHDCTSYCVKRWRRGVQTPPDVYLQLKAKLLAKYPLPNGWQEVYDEGCAQHYYWNIFNNLVSWLPPSHPRASFSRSAARLREERRGERTKESDDSSDEVSDHEPEPPPKRRTDSKLVQRVQADRQRERRDRDRERQERREKRVRLKDNDLDPMDPAAYSDVPRGEWSSGLESRGDAKTGVDTTASGPLFQMRPYPSPGAILMANSKTKPPPVPSKKAVQYPELPK